MSESPQTAQATPGNPESSQKTSWDPKTNKIVIIPFGAIMHSVVIMIDMLINDICLWLTMLLSL